MPITRIDCYPAVIPMIGAILGHICHRKSTSVTYGSKLTSVFVIGLSSVQCIDDLCADAGTDPGGMGWLATHHE